MYTHYERRRPDFEGQHPEFGRLRHHRHHPHPPAHDPFGGEPGPHHFGRRGPGFGGPGFGGPGFGGRGRGRGRGRAQRGDVRAATLILLAEEPMHGYQLMQAIAERTNGAWKPSPGAMYPTLNQLQDEGLIELTNEGGRKLARLTEAGRSYLAESAEAVGDPFADFSESTGVNLRDAVDGLISAVRQIGRSGADVQVSAAAKVLAEARRSLYLILAEDPSVLGDKEQPDPSDGDGS